MGRELERVELLLGKERADRLRAAKVLVAGVGGVGSYAAEALARSGIGHLVLIDRDVVDITNLNRQIMAVHETVAQKKCEAMAERIRSYCPECVVETRFKAVDAESLAGIENCDFAIDAIDTVSAKLDLMEICHAAGVPFISSLGMGNRLDPSKIKVCDLYETQGDPLARSVRAQARKRGMNYPIPVLFSEETPLLVQRQIVDPDGKTRKEQMPPASMVFVPAGAGLLAASYAVRTILKIE